MKSTISNTCFLVPADFQLQLFRHSVTSSCSSKLAAPAGIQWPLLRTLTSFSLWDHPTPSSYRLKNFLITWPTLVTKAPRSFITAGGLGVVLRVPGGSDGKELTCKEPAADAGSIPGLGRCPGGGNVNPLQYPCLENPMDRGALWSKGVQIVRHDWVCLHGGLGGHHQVWSRFTTYLLVT